MTGSIQNNAQPGLKFVEPVEPLCMLNTVPKGLTLDGVVHKYIDLNVPYMEFIGDFSFTLYIKSNLSIGCLFHYRHTGNGSGITEMKAWINQGNLFVSKIIDNGTNEEIMEAVGLVSNNAWQFVSIGIDVSNGKFDVYVQSNNFKYDNSSTPNEELVLPGTIRIGAFYDDSFQTFSGAVDCFNIFNQRVKQQDEQFVIDTCKTFWSWPHKLGDQNFCYNFIINLSSFLNI